MSASASNNLPPEITEAILRLLPEKPLGRFKCVSKAWNSLISDPKFIKNHLLNHNNHQTSKLILLSDTNSLFSININEHHPNGLSATAKEISYPLMRWEEILGSCNGLVLAKDKNKNIFLINPTTKELWEVPLNPFALPPEVSFVIYGFSYIPSTHDDYKLVSISFWEQKSHDCTDVFVSVYSLLNNSWRKLPNVFYDNASRLVSKRSVLINQNLHWLTMLKRGYSSKIITFSLENEEFGEINVPYLIGDGTAFIFYRLVDVGGKLCLFSVFGVHDLWVMEEYGVSDSWTKICIHGPEMLPNILVCLFEGGNRDIVLGGEGKVVVYNIDDRRFRNVRIEGGPNGFFVRGKYVESFESPKRIIAAP